MAAVRVADLQGAESCLGEMETCGGCGPVSQRETGNTSVFFACPTYALPLGFPEITENFKKFYEFLSGLV